MTTPTKKQTRPISSYLLRKSKVRLLSLLALPMTWIVGVYIVSLFLLLVTAFWEVDPFSSLVSPAFNLENFKMVLTVPAYIATSIRTLLIALAVTLICVLWAGYLVKIIAMRLVFTEQGFFNWAMAPFGIRGPGFSIPIVILTLTYLWFPYMALPVYTAIRQIPPNLFDASSDMGAKGFTTIYRVVFPLIIPAVIAGSVFTFSLSLGDYLAARFTGGATQMIGSIIAANINLNPPVAAAYSMIPIFFVVIYLMVARRTGSLERM
ncbi:MAG: ABC transporter permease [Candidatus Nanopelagicaceae bacterium]